MGPQESESTKPEYRLYVYLSSQTPVFGVRMQPITRVGRLINRELEVPPHEINLTWYREQSTSASGEKKIRCCVHQDRLATYQCQSCVDLNLSVKRSYHCSSSCFKEAWKKHEAHHRHATVNVSETMTENQQELTTIDDYVKWLEYVDGSSADDGARIVDGEEKTWIKIGSFDSYTPKEHDIGLSLKLECEVVDCSMGTLLCPMYTDVTDPVIYPPAHPLRRTRECLWRSLDTKKLQVYSPGDVKFTVLSYNLLSDMYITGHLYCPAWARSWEYRGQLIVDEIVEYDPDILCLQEVQTGHFESFFKPELAKYGYSVAYKDKANKLMTYNGLAIDGCATFYRRDMFKEIVKYELEYEKLARPLVETLKPEKKNEGASRLLKVNVALVVILEIMENEGSSASNQPRICVANTHITASELVKDTKLFQVMTLINGLEKISESKIPIVICGDFNSTPPSPQYRFICKHPLDSVPREIDPLGIFQNCKLNHSMLLASAYATFCRSDGIEEHQRRKMDSETKEPLFTTCTPNFTGTLDYIFFTANSLRLERVLELLDREAVPAYLPSALWPSDHIALMGSFAIQPSSYKYACSKIVPPNPWQQEAAVQ